MPLPEAGLDHREHADAEPASPPADVQPGSVDQLRATDEVERLHDRRPSARPALHPGAYFKNADRSHICKSGYSASVRNVAQALKDRVFTEYGITTHSGSTYEVDHLVPLELGGSNSIANLFPEAARPTPGFHEKDRLENRAHDRVCAGARALRATQRSIAKD